MTTIKAWNNGKPQFFDKENTGFPLNLIHPHKQPAVGHLISKLPAWVEHVVIFGSSIRTAHFWFDDLDICVIGQKPTDEPYRTALKIRPRKFSYEFVEYDTLASLMDESRHKHLVASSIVKGVMVYERG